MAMQHPVAGAVRDEFDVARLCHTDEDRVAAGPCGFRLPVSLAPCLPERKAMNVDRVVIHAHVDQPNANPLTHTNYEGSRCRTRLAVKCEPIEFHIHAVRNRTIWQNCVLLERDQVVLVNMRRVRRLRMNNEAAKHSNHFLHRHMGVIEERAVLMKVELVNKTLAGHHRFLTDSGNSVHLDWQFKAVPMNTCWLGKTIFKNDPNSIPFGGLDRWSRCAPVESPQIECPARHDHLFNRLRDKAEDLDTVVCGKRQVANIERGHGDERSRRDLYRDIWLRSRGRLV